MKMTKWISMMLVLSLVIVLAACGNNSNNSNNTTEPAPTANSNKNEEEPVQEEEPAPPANIDLFISDLALQMPGQDDARIKYMEEQNNIDLKIEFLPHGQYEDQLKLKFASGDFPDVYQRWSMPSLDLIEGDKMLVLNDLIEEHGPNLKRLIPQASWDAVSLKGNIYSIPQPSSTLSGSVTFIRKDWLDNLGLEVPTTSQELYDVLVAFRDKDPNGNGKKDEIPFSMRENISWGDNIFGMWGVSTAWTEQYVNNELIFQNVNPIIMKPLEYLNRLYEEKLLDSEFITNSRTIWEQKIKSGMVGVWNHAPNLVPTWQKDLTASLPDEHPDVIVIPTPRGEGYDGPVGPRWSPIAKTFSIFKDAENPEAIVKWLDWLIAEENQMFTELGIEGVDYTKSGETITIDPEKEEAIKWLPNLFKMHSFNEEVSNIRIGDEILSSKLNAAYEIANTQGYVNEMIGAPPVSNNYNIFTMYSEIAAKIILGQEPVSEYENFIKEWKAQGGQQLIDERTQWYNENRK